MKTREKIDQLFSAGTPPPAIAKELKLSGSTVYYHLQRLGKHDRPSMKKRSKVVRSTTAEAAKQLMPDPIHNRQSPPMICFVGSVEDVSRAVKGVFS